MKSPIVITSSLLFLGALLPLRAADLSSATPVTLTQCYEWAKGQNEDLRIRQETIQQSQAKAQSALGDAFPRIAWKLEETWNDPSGVDELEAQGFSGFVEKRQTQSRFTAEQPLFSGLREFSAYSGFKKESKRDALRYERAAFELYNQIAETFYMVLGAETELKNTQAALNLAEDRVKELNGFLRLGKARQSELYTAKAYAAGWRANIDQIQSIIESSRHELSFLTGRDLTNTPLVDQLASDLRLVSLDDALARSKERTDLRAQHEEVDALKLRIRYEKGHFWPSADVTGNYYTERSTFLDKIDWDVILSVDFPLFQGGKVSASVKEARSQYRQSVLNLQRTERRIDSSVRKTYAELLAAVGAKKSLEDAVNAAEQSYESLRKEYRLGLVTNLDVLQAMDFLQTQKTKLDVARVRSKVLFIKLNVEMERML